MAERYRHVLVPDRGQDHPYTYPRRASGPKVNVSSRDRERHAARLNEELAAIARELDALRERRRAVGIATERGMYLEFAGEPGFDLAFKTFENRQLGIEVVAVREEGSHPDTTLFATIFVPPGQLTFFTTRVSDYLEKTTKRGKPKNRALVDSISDIRRAALRSFWTDDPSAFPAEENVGVWWEIWLRFGSDRSVMMSEFQELSRRVGIRLGNDVIDFVERSVLLAFATPQQLATSAEVLDCLAEVRGPRESPVFFQSLPAREQAVWIQDALARTTPPPAGAPAVCVLDTGINAGHPMLAPALSPADVLSCDAAWGTGDDTGHGTAMAGIALYGDLTPVLASTAPIRLEHRLESVKLLPPPHFQAHAPSLYGQKTREAIDRAEIGSPRRPRVICLAVSSPPGDRGRPSSWSAQVDQVAVGIPDGVRRLLVVAAGSIDQSAWKHYPDYNTVAQIEDPGQAWNALTVGAYTDRFHFRDPSLSGWTPVAAPGTLSPSSSTSHSWIAKWPNKPDLVLEGGNGARNQSHWSSAIDDLLLMSTSGDIASRLLDLTWGTSPAAAQAARLAAILSARYPTLWPETIRALLVHSARWTEAMVAEARASTESRPDRVGYLLRRYGYGVPDLERASWSARNSLTLVAQDELLPYHKVAGGRIATHQTKLHRLPWPRAELLSFGDTAVELRITLSYFVEPAASGRAAYMDRYRYASHGLRVAVSKPGESNADFQARVSKDAQEAEYAIPMPGDAGWSIGQAANRGSIHSDWRCDTAANIADRSAIAVFPVGGWWKERPHLGRWSGRARYSLVVSIATPSEQQDVYTPVAQALKLPVEIS